MLIKEGKHMIEFVCEEGKTVKIPNFNKDRW